jgi:hypothetical protein
MHWSPDGTRAAYVTGEQTYLIDETGSVLRKLGGGLGGAAWSADSRTLFFAAKTDDNAPATNVNENWLRQDEVEWTAPPISERFTVSALHGDEVTPVFTVPANLAHHLVLSPDQKWLALLTQVRRATQHDDYRFRLYAYFIPQKRLYLISKSCGAVACFTDTNRLTYVEPALANAPPETSVGHAVEVTLNEADAGLLKVEKFQLVVGDVGWMEAASDDLFLTVVPRTLPGADADAKHQLYRHDRSGGGLEQIASDVYPYFTSSPDGKRILAGQDGDPADRLLLIDAATGQSRVLRAFEEDLAFYPTWRGNDQISFQSRVNAKSVADPNRKQPLYAEIFLYRVTETGLEPVRKLSEKWGDELKPRYDPRS